MDRHAEREKRVMPSHLRTEYDTEIREAKNIDIQSIYEVLSDAFQSYRQDYTEEAYNATVISPDEIEKRMNEKRTEMLVIVYHNKIVGTATITMTRNSKLYIRSMAVRPHIQRSGIGSLLLEEIDMRARQKKCTIISLECYEPLTKAIKLYERHGFSRTGKTRSYHGITIFEMEREL